MADAVYVVDDDPAICDFVSAVLQPLGCEVKTFHSGEAVRTSDICQRVYSLESDPWCVLLDLVMPGESGMDLLEVFKKYVTGEIAGSNGIVGVPCPPPIIVMTARGSVSTAVQSMKLGASDFLEKPFAPEALTKLVKDSLDRHRTLQDAARRKHALRERIARLSPRERELLDAIVQGRSTKMIADTLGISVRTVDHHRANLMVKTEAANVADLVRMAVEADYKSVP